MILVLYMCATSKQRFVVFVVLDVDFERALHEYKDVPFQRV